MATWFTTVQRPPSEGHLPTYTYKDAAITGRGTKPSQINVFTRVLKAVSLTQHPESVNMHCAEEWYLPSFDICRLLAVRLAQ